MKHGSLFAGIGGFDLGFERAGIETVWTVENDKNCNAVLEKHWPDVKRYGDVKDVGKSNLEPVDIISGGFPCQDLSVAGRRQGLAGERSGLWFQFARIVEEMEPEWVVVENVPGLLSSQEGRDFLAILRTLEELRYCGVWRVLDSQYFGVPQRRRRVFVVGHLRGRGSLQVLLESEGSEGHTAEGEEAGKDIAYCLAKGSGTGGQRYGDSQENLVIADPITKSFAKHHGRSAGKDSLPRNVILFQQNQRDEVREMEVAGAVAAEPGSHQQNYVTYQIQTNDGGEHKRKDRPAGGMYVKETDKSLALGSSDQVAIVHENISGSVTPGKRARALRSGASHSYQFVTEDKAYCLSPLQMRGAERSRDNLPITVQGVRRLTPTECERLQGFPDGWTEGLSDSARYRCLGNAVTVNVAEWIGRRIIAAQ